MSAQSESGPRNADEITCIFLGLPNGTNHHDRPKARGVEGDHHGRDWHDETASVMAENGSAWCAASFVGHSIVRASASAHS
jgi:hypothetical protein